MNISGMNLNQISNEMQKYVADYFSSSTISNTDQGLFVESYLLFYDEVKHFIPEKYASLFCNEDKFNGASGLIEFDPISENAKEHEYTIVLLSDENYTKALLLCLLETDEETKTEKVILLNDFVCT